jgi:hypothetical protein
VCHPKAHIGGKSGVPNVLWNFLMIYFAEPFQKKYILREPPVVIYDNVAPPSSLCFITGDCAFEFLKKIPKYYPGTAD